MTLPPPARDVRIFALQAKERHWAIVADGAVDSSSLAVIRTLPWSEARHQLKQLGYRVVRCVSVEEAQCGKVFP